MAILEKEFKAFYEEIKYYGNKEIRDKKKKLKDDFKSSFPDEFKEKFGDEINSSDIRFIDQGSYAIGTTINYENKAFDIDVATIINIDINQYDEPVEVKKVAKDALTNTNREPKIKEPCITVKYTKEGEEKYHLDFPIYANCDGQLYLARGRIDSNVEKVWEKADPEGLNKYFCEENLQIEGLDLTDEEKKQRKQKKRIIRYLKWWKAEKYKGKDNDKIPPSIALTILACKYYKKGKVDDEYNDLKSLYLTVEKISDVIFEETKDENSNKKIILKECKLPKEPYSDCFFKIQKKEEYINTFYNRWTSLKDNLKEAYDEDDERKAGEVLVKVFGDNFPLPEEDKISNEDSFA